MSNQPIRKSATKNYIVLAIILISMIAFGIFAYKKSNAPHAHDDGEVHSH